MRKRRRADLAAVRLVGAVADQIDPEFALRAFGRQIGRAHAELQSLMRISYAVFCLKKKKKKPHNIRTVDRKTTTTTVTQPRKSNRPTHKHIRTCTTHKS